MEQELPATHGKKIRKINFNPPPPPEYMLSSQQPSTTHPTPAMQQNSAPQHMSSSQQLAKNRPTPPSQLVGTIDQLIHASEPPKPLHPIRRINHRVIAPQPTPTSHAGDSRPPQKQAANKSLTNLSSEISRQTLDNSGSQSCSPDHEIAPQQQASQNEEESNISVLGSKRKRGKSVGKGTLDLVSANGGKKVVVVWDPDHWVPRDKVVSGKFTSEIGITIRGYAPVCYKGWSKIEPEIKRKLREKLEECRKHVSLIDYYENMYKDAEHNWVSEAKRTTHEKMKQKRDDMKAKLIENASEDTSGEPAEVTLNDEITIMAEECGRKGGKVHGVGTFHRLNIASFSSSVPINSEWDEMKGNLQKLSSTVRALESENAMLKSMFREILKKLNGNENIDAVGGGFDDMENFCRSFSDRVLDDDADLLGREH